MITVTPLHQPYTYSYQDCDELQALLCDLQRTRSDYLRHPDSVVRSAADWTLEYFGLGHRSHCLTPDPAAAKASLYELYKRLRALAD